MTLGEVRRSIIAKQKAEMARAKERATLDYILADLIGSSVARLFSNSAEYPKIEEVYSSLFGEEKKRIYEEKAKRQDELSSLRFMLFAQAHNERLRGGAKENE